jgi:hypothetical protein
LKNYAIGRLDDWTGYDKYFSSFLKVFFFEKLGGAGENKRDPQPLKGSEINYLRLVGKKKRQPPFFVIAFS